MALTAKKALGAAKKYTDEAIAGGGGGGTRDYEQLTNLPTINSVELKGNRDLAPLVNGKVPAANLPSYVDDVVEGYLYEGHFYEDSQHTTEITGEIGKIYVDLTASVSYRWSGSAFVRVDDVDLSNYYNKTDSDTHYLKKDGASGNYQTVNGSVAVQGEVWAKDDIALSNVAESLAYFNSGTKADKLYNIGDRFVYQGMLLEAIDTINGNSDIVITAGVTQNAKKVTVDEVIEDVASDIPDVSGKADLTVIAGVEASTTSSKAYAIGNLFILTGKLYKATAAIAQGDTIVTSGAGQNVTETTVDAEIAASGGDVSGKADKVQSATNGDFAGLDANGNLTDSGHKHSDYMAAMTVDSAPTSGSNNLVSSGGVYSALDDKCDLTNIAKVFTTSDTYRIGDWVFYEGRLYKCTTLHQGAWNSSHFSAYRVDQLIPDDMLSLYGKRSSISTSGTSPGKSSISAGGYSFSAFEFDTEYTVSGNEYALYNGLRYIDFDVIMGNDVYRNYKYYDASPYEAEYQSLNELSYPFFFVVIDPEGYPFAIKMYDINITAGTFKMKISYLNGYYRNAGEIYLAINSFEKA
jgi:hypothetical protein